MGELNKYTKLKQMLEGNLQKSMNMVDSGTSQKELEQTNMNIRIGDKEVSLAFNADVYSEFSRFVDEMIKQENPEGQDIVKVALSIIDEAKGNLMNAYGFFQGKEDVICITEEEIENYSDEKLNRIITKISAHLEVSKCYSIPNSIGDDIYITFENQLLSKMEDLKFYELSIDRYDICDRNILIKHDNKILVSLVWMDGDGNKSPIRPIHDTSKKDIFKQDKFKYIIFDLKKKHKNLSLDAFYLDIFLEEYMGGLEQNITIKESPINTLECSKEELLSLF